MKKLLILLFINSLINLSLAQSTISELFPQQQFTPLKISYNLYQYNLSLEEFIEILAPNNIVISKKSLANSTIYLKLISPHKTSQLKHQLAKNAKSVSSGSTSCIINKTVCEFIMRSDLNQEKRGNKISINPYFKDKNVFAKIKNLSLTDNASNINPATMLIPPIKIVNKAQTYLIIQQSLDINNLNKQILLLTFN